MTFRENYLRVLHHQKPEFTPVFFSTTASCGFGAGNGPWFEKGPAGGGKDGFGVRWATPSSGGGAPTPAANSAVLDDITEWEEKVQFPDVDAFDWEAEAARELAGVDREQLVVDYGCGNGVWERLLALLGTEEAFYSMIVEQDAVNALFEKITDYKIKIAEKAKKYYDPDAFTNYDDIAASSSLFFSPEIYRTCIKPHHTRLNEAVKDLGMIPIYHCCGKAESLIEDFIETGAEAWTSVQPSNDIEYLLKEYGDRIAIMGGYDNNGPCGMPDATDEMVRAEVRRCMSTYGKYDGYVLFGARIVNSLDPEAVGAAYVPIIDEALKCTGFPGIL